MRTGSLYCSTNGSSRSRIPLCPSSSAFQVSSALVATDVVIAIPVTTTLGRPFPVLRRVTWDEFNVAKAEFPRIPGVRGDLETIVHKALKKDPAERYQSCHELIDDLSRHPLVAKGGPITLQTKMSPAAATMVGQKTPVSGQRPLPSISPSMRHI